MKRGFLPSAAVLALLVDCANPEIPTPSTEGSPPEILARLRVPTHHDRLVGFWHPDHLRTLVIDDVPYELTRETTEFWLLPRAEDEECLHGPKTWHRSPVKDLSINCFHQPPLLAEALEQRTVGHADLQEIPVAQSCHEAAASRSNQRIGGTAE
jgi:hypothetical protein